MPRNMSFALTRPQIENRTKTVTRRVGWWFLKSGDVVNAVHKAMGLKLGEHPVKLATLRIVSVRREPLNAITIEDVAAEGFADHPAVMNSPTAFVEMFVAHNSPKVSPETIVNRIEFEYL